ncbi:MAG: permease-like cell division protein FtsX [Paludibacteraceae bacterium]|jgi:cell division transport system permease protein|nr:permease-like cell division protein FtsX [Paludibacteraceae bacterium]
MSQKVKTKKFFNSNFTTTISISMVLFLVGVITLLTLAARGATEYVKENINFTIVLNDEVEDLELTKLENRLSSASYVKSYRSISKEEALKELERELGESPEDFLGYNPLQASYEVFVKAEFANKSEMSKIVKEISSYEVVKEVVYQENVVDSINTNIRNVSIVLLCVTLLLLVVSIGLINNTIRLQLYSKRFLINTMKMVGATSWFIRRPFMGRSILNGFVASLLAILTLGGIVYYLHYYYDLSMLNLMSVEVIVITTSIITFLGVFISLVSSMFAVGKYLRIKTNDLYII